MPPPMRIPARRPIRGQVTRTSSQPSVVEEKTMELVYKILSWIGLAVITVIILLVVRVICESIIVLFNIAESLVSIDKKTAVQTVIA